MQSVIGKKQNTLYNDVSYIGCILYRDAALHTVKYIHIMMNTSYTIRPAYQEVSIKQREKER